MITAWNDLMYSIICQNQNVILNRIRQKQDVDEYDWLIQTIACQPWPADFEGRYRRFFVMGRVSASYYTPYFQALGAARTQTPNLAQLCAALWRVAQVTRGVPHTSAFFCGCVGAACAKPLVD
jgi:hypothetical protein